MVGVDVFVGVCAVFGVYMSFTNTVPTVIVFLRRKVEVALILAKPVTNERF